MTTTSDVRPSLESVNGEFMEAFKRGDFEAISRLYTTDAELLPPNSDVVRGHDAVQAFWAGAMKLGLKEVALNTVEVDVSGDTAVETGRYTLHVEGGAVADRGKYLVVWKQRAGAWRLHRDIWATSEPAPASA